MKITRLGLMLFGVVVLMQFNNCSPMADKSAFDNSYLLSTCDPSNIVDPITGVNTTNPNADANNVNCAVADQNNISISPQGGDISVALQQGDFNVAGTCDAGGFPSNVIAWTLVNSNGTPVRNSGMIYQSQNWNGQCINGQFTLYIELISIPEDANSRIGLRDPTVAAGRAPYTLNLQIVGIDSQGVAHANMIFGVRVLNLAPL